MESSVTDYI
jgi:DNA-directed RNA polymerase I subunit RPA1